jgi:FG-GAP repeat protein
MSIFKCFVVSCACVSLVHAQTLTEDLKYQADDLSSEAEFGHSIDTDDGMVVVGAVKALNHSVEQGAVYVFQTDSVQQVLKITSPNDQESDRFGQSVAIEDGIIAVGAIGTGPGNNLSGSAYLFDTNGNLLHTLVPDDLAANDQFGGAIAIHNNIVAVGAHQNDELDVDSGAVYLFDTLTGDLIRKIFPADGKRGDRFGAAVAMDNDTLVVGAHGVEQFGPFSGAIYVYDIPSGIVEHRILADDPREFSYFGRSVDIDGDLVAVGASGHGLRAIDAGAAYLFDRISGTQLQRFIPADTRQDDRFGFSVDVEGDRLLSASVSDTINNHVFTGSAYLFDTNTYLQTAKIFASDGRSGDDFGYSVAMDGNTIAVGARDESFNFESAGAAYVFNLCKADINQDSNLNFLDVSDFLAAFAVQDPAADFFQDGSFNFIDVSIFLSEFAEYCP